MTNEEVVRRYWEAHRVNDLDAMTALRHVDWTAQYPQSGERIRGDANQRAIMSHYPGGAPALDVPRVIGSDAYVMTPMFTIERIVGSGDYWWGDGRATYPDGSLWHLATLVQLRDGKIYRETDYFAAAFEAPGWRAAWVERMDADEPLG